MRLLYNITLPITIGIILLLIGVVIVERYGLAYEYGGIDKLLHFAGGFSAAWFVAILFRQEVSALRPWVAILMLLGSVALIGVLWEFAEYAGGLAKVSYPRFYHYFHGGDLSDTLGDLLADLVGGTSFAFMATPTLTFKRYVLSSENQST